MERGKDIWYVMVSVPLRGFLFLTVNDEGLINQLPFNSFRPLTGIFVFNEFLEERMSTINEDVSVPLRGFLFLTARYDRGGVGYIYKVSVPLRGFLFLTRLQ